MKLVLNSQPRSESRNKSYLAATVVHPGWRSGGEDVDNFSSYPHLHTIIATTAFLEFYYPTNLKAADRFPPAIRKATYYEQPDRTLSSADQKAYEKQRNVPF